MCSFIIIIIFFTEDHPPHVLFPIHCDDIFSTLHFTGTANTVNIVMDDNGRPLTDTGTLHQQTADFSSGPMRLL